MTGDATMSSVLEVKTPMEAERASAVPAEGVAIGEAARRTGVSVHALRYYERAGLVITGVERTRGGRRRYRQPDLDWIVVCTNLRATGMPIKTIRRYAELVSAGPGNEQERLALLELHRAAVNGKLDDIKQNLTLLEYKIAVYRDRIGTDDAGQLFAPRPK